MKLVVNNQQTKILKRIFMEFLWGKTTDYIEREGVINCAGGTKWQPTTIDSMRKNEKYKGDMLVQKSYAVDFLTKKRVQNKVKSSSIILKMTMRRLWSLGFRNVCRWRRSGGRSIWRSIILQGFPRIRRRIHF